MVFTTIRDNLKSFFQKEDELERDPKQPPDASIELYERPIAKEHTIVDHRLRREEPRPRPELPFSAKELRERLGAPAPDAVAPAARSGPRSAQPAISQEDIASQIREFEEAITSIPGEDGSTVPLSSGPAAARPVPKGECYFDRVADRLRRGELDHGQLHGALDAMKAHHEERSVHADRKAREAELEQRFARQLAVLQGLERDWAGKRDEIGAASKRMAELEARIEEETAALKELVATMHEHGPLELPGLDEGPGDRAPASPAPAARPPPEAPAEPGAVAPFILADGRAVPSLDALRDALVTMADATFYHHVRPERNDFAVWIGDGLGDAALAARVRGVQSKHELARLLERR